MKVWQLFENFSLSELNANFAELLASINGTKATYLTANKTVYVATTGSDTTGDGTSGNPYKTITKGLSVIPKNLNGFEGTLHIAGGTYTDSIAITGYEGGKLFVYIDGDVTIPTYINIISCQCVYFNSASSVTLTINAPSIAIQLQFSNVRFKNVNLMLNLATPVYGYFIGLCSNFTTSATVTINNASDAIYIDGNSSIFIQTLAGSGNAKVIRGLEGSKISYGTKTITATTDRVLAGGAIITNLITMP